MNVSASRSNLARSWAIWGLHLTIAAPLLLVPIAPLISAQPLKAETAPMAETDDRTHDHHATDGSDRHDMHDTHNMPTHHDHHHGHDAIEVDATQPIPTVAIAIHPDSASGWNLEIITTNFELTGATAGQANRPDQGHAHLYANGVKIARVYGDWYHIPTLPSGEVAIDLVLNSNQHQVLTQNGMPIAASTTIITD
jgi:hypothetical protein